MSAVLMAILPQSMLKSLADNASGMGGGAALYIWTAAMAGILCQEAGCIRVWSGCIEASEVDIATSGGVRELCGGRRGL